MHPIRRHKRHFQRQNQRYDDVAEQDDHAVGRHVVGAVMVQCLAAVRARFCDLEKAPEQASLAARRAAGT
jgi:hypothetical protein